MTKFFRVWCIFTSILLLGLSYGCTDDKVYKIGISQCSSDDWREKMNSEIEREVMLHDNLKVEIRSAEDNSAKQIEDLRYFADNGFDIIVVSPNEAIALTPAVEEIYSRGIPVIIFDRNITSDAFTARIGADDYNLGRSAAHYAFHLLKKSKNALEIYGLPGSTPAHGRHAGFSEGFTEGGGILLATVPANWNQSDAERVVDSLLHIYNNVDLIFAHNDRMAIGASQVARRLGRGDVKIIGIDAAPNIGIQAVADSVIDATFLYPTEGHRLIRTAEAILTGKPFPRETILPSSSAVDLSNADILLLQNEALIDETQKLKVLKDKSDEYWHKYTSQTMLSYASGLIIALLVGLVFMILRVYWQHKNHQRILLEQNKELEEQRDMQRSLNLQLQDAIQSKLMFFTNVSHDLRTPLTLIAEPIAQLEGAPNLTSHQQKLVKLADKNTRILHRLINQILDFRKYENDKLDLNLTEIDLGQALADWVESFYPLARKRDMKLTLTVPVEDSSLVTAVDVEKLERVVFNLISNAFKYTPDNGAIDVSYTVENDKAVIRVADTGRGISERDLGNIFDRFYQVERVHPNGSGIGLSLTKAFVELHGGTISVESELSKGSVFTVALPIRHVADHAEAHGMTITADDISAELDIIEIEPHFDDDKPLVLVIDDNKDIQRLVTLLMTDRYNVITASNGSEGIKKAVKYVPDLIICDVMMPVMDGLECCRKLKEDVTTSHIPVLMLTACSLDEQRVQGYDSGADGYLAKPFSDAVLQARCASLIANRKRIKDLWTASAANITEPAGTEKPKAAPVKATTADIDNEFYNRFLEIFSENMGNQELSVDGIATEMGLERSQFYRKIKALTNYSPVELIRSLRLKHARTLLTTTDKTVSEIAYETGFSTPAYFTKCFRDAFGQTPSELRNKISG